MPPPILPNARAESAKQHNYSCARFGQLVCDELARSNGQTAGMMARVVVANVGIAERIECRTAVGNRYFFRRLYAIV